MLPRIPLFLPRVGRGHDGSDSLPFLYAALLSQLTEAYFRALQELRMIREDRQTNEHTRHI